MDWKQELFKRLDALSEKLGVAAGHLWVVLTRQGYAIGMENVLIGLVWLGLWIAMMVVGAKMRNKVAPASKYSENEWIFGGWVVTGVGQVCLLGVGTYLFDGIVYLINPEFFALQQLLSVFGK